MSDTHPSVQKLLADVTVPAEIQQPQVNAATESISESSEDKEDANIGSKVSEEQKPPKEEPSAEMIDAGAELAISVFDFAQSNLFKFFAKRKGKKKAEKLFGTESEALLNNALSKAEIKETLTQEEVVILRIHKQVEEIVDQLPLSDDEKKAIKIPLVIIMKQKGGSLPPEYALALALLQVAGGRAAEIFML